MFDITELDEVICRHLRTYDLAQCAQVSKKWHAIVAPHLWQDLTPPTIKTKALCKLVLDDHLYAQQYQAAMEGDCETDQHSHAPSTTSLPALTKYGKWVRWLPGPADLLQELRPVLQHRQVQPRHDVEVTAHELILHLFTRCPAFKLRYFMLHCQHLEERSGLWTAILENVIPRVRFLSVHFSRYDHHPSFSKLVSLMDRCSVTLERLIVEVGITSTSIDTTQRIDDDEEHESTIGWTSLRELTLLCRGDGHDPKVFWTWLFKRCRRSKKLAVNDYRGSVKSAVECMLGHMPHLDEIQICPNFEMKDEQIATLLTGSTQGWKVIRLFGPLVMGESVTKAVLGHSSTLEVLHVYGRAFTSNDLVRVLASCPNLRCLDDYPGNDRAEDSRYIHVNEFIDRDLDTGALRTWKCEASLKELRVKIKGIPRPDVKEIESEKETYPGQAREIQGYVYDRLARLINLETLWLEGKSSSKRYSGGLEMSLESGLHKLSGLKMLKELDVTQWKARVGVQEVQWMTQQWPRLHVVGGLCSEENVDAIAWLRENHPEIKVRR